VTRFDVAIVGGGINGCFVALAAARAGLHAVLLERGRLGGDLATLRSGGLVRLHYPTAAEAWLALEGRRIYAAGGLGFVRTGFLRFAAPGESLEAAIEMLRELGSDSRLLDAGEIRRLDPSLVVGDDEVASYEAGSGYADPRQTMAAVVARVRSSGVDVREGTAAEALLPGEGLRADGATVRADRIVLAAGAWSRDLAATAEVDLPIVATGIHVLRARGPRPALTVIDPPNGVYFRPDGDDGILLGRRTIRDLELESLDGELPPAQDDFEGDALAGVAGRWPAAAGARTAGWHAGMLDMTPDGRPLFGPAEAEGLWLACGWSGTGFKSAPAAGPALVEWMQSGKAPHPSLEELRPDRAFAAAEGRSPH
jgi:sarcosine oxidase subunit beta